MIVLPEGPSGFAFPAVRANALGPFLQEVHASSHKWVILVAADGEPHWAIEAHRFLRSALLDGEPPNPRRFCHRPIVIRDATATSPRCLGSDEDFRTDFLFLEQTQATDTPRIDRKRGGSP